VCRLGRLGTIMGPVAGFCKCCNEPFGYIEWASSRLAEYLKISE
jgi:hypothetical protein